MMFKRPERTVLLIVINVCVFAIEGAESGLVTSETTSPANPAANQKPAFSARTPVITNPQNIQNLFFEIQTKDQIIVFGEVITDTGNPYNPVTGIFFPPSAGQYFFTTSVQDVSNRGGTTLHITLNGRRVAEVSAPSSNPGQEPQGSNSVVLELRAGDEVAVKSFNAGGKIIGSFTGFQI